MALTVALWLASGTGLVVLAWLAAPTSFPAGEGSCVIAGVGGAFVGGELFVVLGGPVHTHPDVLTMLGAIAGSLLCLDLVMQAAGPRSAIGQTPLTRAWLSLMVWSPVIFAAAIGVALARANGSPLLGVAVTIVVVVLVVSWHQYHRLGVRSR